MPTPRDLVIIIIGYGVWFFGFAVIWCYVQGRKKGWWGSWGEMLHDFRTRKDWPDSTD